ncbi:MAG TPA: zf-HC2 domain-containing protein [Blastocatellia bacterium]|nr:zf-HC2 domain-containing protein [Blastocatellia bacterium]
MSEHLTQTQIEDYGRQKLSAAEFLSASRHLEVCEACRLEVERVLDDEVFYALRSEVFAASAESVTSNEEQSHLTFDRTAAYVDGTLAGEELQIVKDHLTSCEQCAMAAHDLRDFRNQVSPGLNREYQPPLAPPAKEIRWRRFVATLRPRLPRSPALIFSSALAALLMIATGWLMWQAIERNGKNPKITQTTPAPTTPVVPPTPTREGAAAVIAQLNDGAGQVALDEDGKLSGVDHLPPVYQQMIKNALSSQRLEKPPLLAGLVRPDGLSMRSGDNQGARFSVISPVGIVMLSDRPTFRWSPMEGATGYVVEVYDDNLRQVIASSQGADTSWTALQSLKRGGIYSWQVKAIKGGEEFSSPRPPEPEAKFRILDETLANELIQARRAYASSHLTLALVYTRAGLLDEAEQEFRALQKANPNSVISRRLLAHLREMRR